MQKSEFITITAVDRHSSDSTSRSFTVHSAELLKAMIEDWEKTTVPYSRYELMTQDFEEEFEQEVLDVLDELEVTF